MDAGTIPAGVKQEAMPSPWAALRDGSRRLETRWIKKSEQVISHIGVSDSMIQDSQLPASPAWTPGRAVPQPSPTEMSMRS